MRRLLFACALLTGTSANAVEFYVKPMVSLVDMSGYDNGYALGLGIARPLPQLTPYLSAEAEFLKSFSQLRNNDGKVSFSKTAVFAALTYPFDPRVQIKGKAGIRYATFSGANDDNDIGMDWGAGALLLLDNLHTISFEYIVSDENDFTQLVAAWMIPF